MAELHTERLLMRRWRDADREPFAVMNADPRVMEHFPAPLERAASDALADRAAARLDADGHGLWALEESATGTFIGFTGLAPVGFDAPFAPATEIGWRLAAHAWGHGYATEAALAAVEYAFTEAGLDELVSFTTVANERSRAVMRRIGMHHDPSGDFGHPLLPAGHRIAPHVLYRLDRAQWRSRQDRR